ncbi:hypothetical protein TrRE_jg7811 [Triparma retinervis]|uniref:Uncharacterized protein n=1 Tax=Triparma retinervis TaxID=2557542 RepID=A0A9W7DPZ4_9STRA|nr:hypothetical protein TrRE_jg7811 [Triparma retinervis]
MESFDFGVLCRRKGNNASAITAFTNYLNAPVSSSSPPSSIPQHPSGFPTSEAPPKLFLKEPQARFNLASSYADAKDFPSSVASFNELFRRVEESCDIQIMPVEPVDVEKAMAELEVMTAPTEAPTSCPPPPPSPWTASLKSTPAPIPAIIQASFSSLGSIHLKLNEPGAALRAIVLSMTISHPRAPEPADYYNMNIALRQLGHQNEATKLSWRLMGEAFERKGEKTPISPISPRPAPLPPHPATEDHATSQRSNPANIICVKYGKKYGPDYVNRLFAGVRRTTKNHSLSFFCLTDDAEGIHLSGTCSDDVNIIPLSPKPFKSSRRNPAGWWHKACLFNPTLKARFSESAAKNIYIDLDTVVVGDLGLIIDGVNFPDPAVRFATLNTDDMVNERRRDGLNTSVMVWENDDIFDDLYNHLDCHFDVVGKYIYKLDHWFEMMFFECKGGVGGCGGVKEYKRVKEEGTEGEGWREGVSLVTFPLHPKPHDCAEEDAWVKNFWLGGGGGSNRKKNTE